jgi:hypothetical protein
VIQAIQERHSILKSTGAAASHCTSISLRPEIEKIFHVLDQPLANDRSSLLWQELQRESLCKTKTATCVDNTVDASSARPLWG